MTRPTIAWRSRGELTRVLPLWNDQADQRRIEVYLPPDHRGQRAAAGQERRDPPWTVLCFAGGGYGSRSWHEGPGTALWLAMHGLVGVSVPYRVASDARPDGREHGEGERPLHPQPLRDACRAVRVIRDHAGQLGLEPGKVAVLGYSAGGHCAGSAAILHAETHGSDDLSGTWSGRPDAAALIYPVISMVPPCHDGSWKNLLGESATRAERESMSLETRVTKDCPPLFIVHAADDGVVPLKGATELAGLARRAGVRSSSHVWPTGGHGFGLARSGRGLPDWTPLFMDWLRGV